MLTDVGGVVAGTSTDANEEEVDDIGNGCGDSYFRATYIHTDSHRITKNHSLLLIGRK